MMEPWGWLCSRHRRVRSTPSPRTVNNRHSPPHLCFLCVSSGRGALIKTPCLHRRCRTRSPFPERNGSLVAPNGDAPVVMPSLVVRGGLRARFKRRSSPQLEAKVPTKRCQRPADGDCEDRLLLAGAAAGCRRTSWAYAAGNYAGKSATVKVKSYIEPSGEKYVNYCGPAASQVLISNWTDNVPTIDTLGDANHEKTALYNTTYSEIYGQTDKRCDRYFLLCGWWQRTHPEKLQRSTR